MAAGLMAGCMEEAIFKTGKDRELRSAGVKELKWINIKVHQ